MPSTPLRIYLQDHLAGATAGVALARRVAGANTAGPHGPALAGVASEIAEDVDELHRLMVTFGVPRARGKMAGAWLGERVARLKPNGRLRSGDELHRMHELEMLSLGIAGKLALWEALLRASPAEFATPSKLKELARRAREQRNQVEAARLSRARVALGTERARER